MTRRQSTRGFAWVFARGDLSLTSVTVSSLPHDSCFAYKLFKKFVLQNKECSTQQQIWVRLRRDKSKRCSVTSTCLRSCHRPLVASDGFNIRRCIISCCIKPSGDATKEPVLALVSYFHLFGLGKQLPLLHLPTWLLAITKMPNFYLALKAFASLEHHSNLCSLPNTVEGWAVSWLKLSRSPALC